MQGQELALMTLMDLFQLGTFYGSMILFSLAVKSETNLARKTPLSMGNLYHTKYTNSAPTLPQLLDCLYHILEESGTTV